MLSCLDADPTEAAVHYELARLERESENWSGAHAAILEANALDGANPWYRKELAEIALELGLYAEADATLEWIFENKPEDDLSARRLLDLRTAQGDLSGALDVVDVLEREWGPDPEWHFDRHRLHMAAGDIEASLEALIRLEADFPDVVEATLQRARILTGLGRQEEAEAALQEALARSENGRLHLEWAHILTRQGNTDDARRHVRIAFASDEVPMEEKADIAWTYVELAEIQQELRPEAAALIDLLIEATPWRRNPSTSSPPCATSRGHAGRIGCLGIRTRTRPQRTGARLDACQLAIDLEVWDAVDRLTERAGVRFPTCPFFPTSEAWPSSRMAMTGAPSANSRWPATSSWTGPNSNRRPVDAGPDCP